jgi:translation initiation factor IF-2
MANTQQSIDTLNEKRDAEKVEKDRLEKKSKQKKLPVKEQVETIITKPCLNLVVKADVHGSMDAILSIDLSNLRCCVRHSIS